MGRADDALVGAFEVLLAEHGETARVNGECVSVLIDRNPRLFNQAKPMADLEGQEFSRIEMLRSETDSEIKTGMTFVDRCGNKHRIRSFRIIDDRFQYECVVSPGS